MARKPGVTPRKTATQARSRNTVDVLIEATARILVRDGFDNASTNRIAEVAGVSVGSLYQYFPSKEALVAAVSERHQQQIMQTVRSGMAEALGEPLERAMHRIVAVAVKAHRVDPRLHCVLAEQVPRVGKLKHLETLSRENYALFRAYIERHTDEVRVKDLDLATFVCVTTVEALTHNAVLHHCRMFVGEAMDALIDAIAMLMIGYLKGGAVESRRT